MKIMYFAAVSALAIALGAAPAQALSLNVGASAGATGSVNGSGGSLSLDASTSAKDSTGAAAGPTGTSAVAGAGATTASLSGSHKASVDGPIAKVIALIDTSVWSNASFSHYSQARGTTTYNVDGWVSGDNKTALSETLTANARKISRLQAAIVANASLSAELKAKGIAPQDVIAAGVAADGSLAVFTHAQ